MEDFPAAFAGMGGAGERISDVVSVWECVMIATLIAATAVLTSANYDCKLSEPYSVEGYGVRSKLEAIKFLGLPEKAWQFNLQLNVSATPSVNIVWPLSPLGTSGSFRSTVTGPSSVVVQTTGEKACFFTSNICVSIINLVAQADGTVHVLILPAAISKNRATGESRPFVAILEGRCARATGSQ